MILTVIAVCLVVLCLVFAQMPGSGTQRVVIAGFDAQALHEGVPVLIAGGKGSVPVKVAGGSGPVPVNITTVAGKAGAPLPVSIAK